MTRTTHAEYMGRHLRSNVGKRIFEAVALVFTRKCEVVGELSLELVVVVDVDLE